MGTGSGSFDISLPDVRSVTGNVSGQLTGALNTALQLEALTLNPAAFSQLGAPVATASTAVHRQLSQTVRALLALLQQLNTNVAGAAGAYQQYDQNAATTLGATPAGTTAATASQGSTTTGLGSIVAGYAQQSSTPAGTPASVGTVVGYLAAAQPGRSAAQVPASALASPAALADWLDRDPRNQTALGLAKVYSGGQVRPGDVVVGVTTGGTTAIGVAGFDGQLYNNGPVAGLTGLAAVRGVYRPMTAQTALW
ncbi:MAG TPA: hypothetical protein VJT31_35295 [Rugosimonospora sp.]|nr:hypothetical protein [Rugosimonospora sp.]